MLNVFWTKVASKRGIKQFNFFNWLSNVKNLVLSNGSEHLQNVIQRHKNSFFPKKLQKIVQRLQSLWRLVALPPEPRLRYL